MTNDIDSIQYIMYMGKKLHKEIGFIGLGIMGKPMVKNLLKSKYAIYFYARKKRVINEIKQLGGKYFDDIGEISKVCKIIIVNLPESRDVKEVILSKHGLWKNISKDTIIIDMSTISPDVTVSLSKKLKNLKAYLIDAPVSGGEIGAIKGNLVLLDRDDNTIVELDSKTGIQKNSFPLLWPSLEFNMTNKNIVIGSNRLLYVVTM